MTSTDFTINIKSKRKIYGIIGALITLLVPYLLLLFNQDKNLETAQSLCPFKMLTGFPCPGCGITKSMVFFYEGNLLKSVYYHLLGPIVIAFCILTIVVLTTELITQKEYFNKWFFNKKLAFGLGIFLATYHFIRILYFIKSNSIAEIMHQSIWR